MNTYICPNGCLPEARIVECESGPHHAKAICPECDRFIAWVPKPNGNTKRPSGKKLIRWHSENGIDYCQMCLRKEHDLYKNETYEGHHVIEHQDGGTDDHTNVWKLCTSCHSFVHWRRTYRRDSSDRPIQVDFDFEPTFESEAEPMEKVLVRQDI